MYNEIMNNEDKPVKISISGKLIFEENVTLNQAAQIIAFIDSSSVAMNTPRDAIVSPRLSTAGSIISTSNPREALELSGAKTNPEKIVTFALYIGQEGAKDTFTLEDIKPLFRRARESTPRNISRDLDAAIRMGWVAEGETSGEFYVTSKAAHVFETGFDAIRGSRVNTLKKRGTPNKKIRKSPMVTPIAFNDIDIISPTSEMYGDYHKLKTKTDKFLWAVNAAKVLGIPALDNQSIVWLTDQLGEGIATGDIAGYFRQNRNAGYVNRSTQDNKIRITPKGEEYLRNKVIEN